MVQEGFRVLGHNLGMIRLILRFGFASLLLLFGGAALFAQDSEPTVDDDRSSEKVEQKNIVTSPPKKGTYGVPGTQVSQC